jgi:hypothetical protein
MPHDGGLSERIAGVRLVATLQPRPADMSNRFARLFAAATLALFAACGAQAAALTTYDIVLTVDQLEESPCGTPVAGIFGCVRLGDAFRGHMTIDTSLLATDGFNFTATLVDFWLPFGDTLYSTRPDNEVLAGFSNGQTGPFDAGWPKAPGLVIQGGQVVDLVGNVHGSSDVPFIDFSGSYLPSNRFLAVDGPTRALGSLLIASAVPEPESVVLMLAGVAMLLYVRVRRTTTA